MPRADFRTARVVLACRMRSFAHIREILDDVQMTSPVLVGIAKLVIVSGLMLNILGGAW